MPLSPPLPPAPGPDARRPLVEAVRQSLHRPAADAPLAAADQATLVAFAALLHGPGIAEAGGWLAPLRALGPESEAPLRELADTWNGQGPLAPSAADRAPPALPTTFAPPLATALERVRQLLLAPRASEASQTGTLLDLGWNGRQVSAISQLTAAVAMLVRMDLGTTALAASHAPLVEHAAGGDFHPGQSNSDSDLAALEAQLRTLLTPDGPRAWVPWIPLEEDGYDWVAHFDPERAKRAAFRASAGDRTLARHLATLEDAIFEQAPRDAGPGLWRRGRELGALAASSLNGCLVCTSIHALNYARYGGPLPVALALAQAAMQPSAAARPEAAATLAAAAFALTQTPVAFTESTLHALAGLGMDRRAVLDLIHAVAYFNFANRMVLSLGGQRSGRPHATTPGIGG